MNQIKEPKRICISMDDDTEKRVRDIAKKNRITVSRYIRQALQERWYAVEVSEMQSLIGKCEECKMNYTTHDLLLIDVKEGNCPICGNKLLKIKINV